MAQQTARNVNESFGIYLDSLKQVGTYPTTQKVRSGRMNRQIIFNDLITNSSSLTEGVYVTKRTGTVTITRFDTVNHIVSGVFDGVLYMNRDSTKSVNISDGRFDVRYQYAHRLATGALAAGECTYIVLQVGRTAI